MTKKIVTIFIIIFIILIIIFVLFKLPKIYEEILKKIYPTGYSEYVEKYSEENNLDKYLVYAVIKAESNFNPEVKSSSGAIGLMQLMEETAMERSNIIDEKSIETFDLYDPETNIRLGTSYLAYLIELYDGNLILAVTAYNAGLGNVEEWIKQGIIREDGSDIENIPYTETNNYVRKILNNYRMYLKIYN